MIETYDVVNGQYSVQKFDEQLELAKNFIKENAKTNLVIQSEDDLKSVKKSRTVINAKLKEIEDKRKALNEAVMGRYNNESKTIEKLFKETYENLTNKINEYEEKLGKPKILTLIIKTYDQKVIDKIRKYASGLDCEVK